MQHSSDASRHKETASVRCRVAKKSASNPVVLYVICIHLSFRLTLGVGSKLEAEMPVNKKALNFENIMRCLWYVRLCTGLYIISKNIGQIRKM